MLGKVPGISSIKRMNWWIPAFLLVYTENENLLIQIQLILCCLKKGFLWIDPMEAARSSGWKASLVTEMTG